MKNKLTDLNNSLFEQLERLNDDDLKGEKLNEQVEKTKQITKIAQTIINNNKLILDSVKTFSDAGYMVKGQNAMKALGLESYEDEKQIDFSKVTFKSKSY